MIRATIQSTIAVLCLATSARAHFVWLDLETPSAGPATVQAYFGELPEPGEPQLIGKIATTKAWARGADGKTVELKWAAPDEKTAALVAQCDRDSAYSVEATCDYGVYQRGPKGVRLFYYAKHLADDWAVQPADLRRAERLRLDIVPALADDKLVLSVLFDGKSDAGRELVVHTPEGAEQQLKTDEQGRAELTAAAGRYAVRVGHIQPDSSGELNGKSYAQTWHYATLTLAVPEITPAEIDAAELLKRAREARSLWIDFPGLSADVTLTAESEQLKGKLAISSDGSVTLDLPETALRKWAVDQLESLVQHRMPDGEVAEGTVTYADSDRNHPLGRKIDLGDADAQSRYRIRGDEIREVSRNAGPMRFTISVLEITRNADNKCLPRSFTMNFFDAASGDLKTSLAYWNDWQRVGDFDVPRVILETSTHGKSVLTRQIVFKNCRLRQMAD
jgi:uncharacterized GH25 family protein